MSMWASAGKTSKVNYFASFSDLFSDTKYMSQLQKSSSGYFELLKIPMLFLLAKTPIMQFKAHTLNGEFLLAKPPLNAKNFES